MTSATDMLRGQHDSARCLPRNHNAVAPPPSSSHALLFGRCTERRTPRIVDSLDIIKFLCKDFWTSIFKRKVDKLQTNHRGVYVLQDYEFRWLIRFSSTDDETSKREAMRYLIFPCGLIRGALANLGVTAVVNADISTVPSCKCGNPLRCTRVL